MKELRLLFGSTNQYLKLVPTLASLRRPFRSLLFKKTSLNWNEDHTKAFERIKQKFVSLTENSLFDVK